MPYSFRGPFDPLDGGWMGQSGSQAVRHTMAIDEEYISAVAITSAANRELPDQKWPIVAIER